jgi:hypothetical protein
MVAALALGMAATVVSAVPAAANPPCHANSDGSLNCGNTAPTTVWESPQAQAGGQNRRVDTLRSNPSWFKCWTNDIRDSTIWYFTYGDDTGQWGFVRQTAVFTPTDPFPGVRHC